MFLKQSMFQREKQDVRSVLVAGLSAGFVPSITMLVLTLTSGPFLTGRLEAGGLISCIGAVTLGYSLKIATIFAHKRSLRTKGMLAEISFWDRLHGVGTVATALPVAALNVLALHSDDLSTQVVTTTLLLLFAAGMTSRLAIRPVIAVSSLLSLMLPSIAVCILQGDPMYHYIAFAQAIGLVAAIDTVRHNYRKAVAQILLQLDTDALARQDPLTGLLNRLGLKTAFRTAIDTSQMVAVHCFDLDGFKPINDTFGHSVGDELLRQIAARLNAMEAGALHAARVGGDEFVVLQVSNTSSIDAADFARCIERIVELPFRAAGEDLRIGMSLGTCVSNVASADLEAMIQEADAASYAAKRYKREMEQRRRA